MDPVLALKPLTGEIRTRESPNPSGRGEEIDFLETLNEMENPDIGRPEEEPGSKRDLEPSRESSFDERETEVSSTREKREEREADAPQEGWEAGSGAAPVQESVQKDDACAAPPSDSSSNLSQVREQLIDQIQARLNPTAQEGKIALMPSDLGEIRYQISRNGEGIVAALTATQGVVLQALEGNLQLVKQAFALAGLMVDRVAFSPQDGLLAGDGTFLQHHNPFSFSGSEHTQSQHFVDLTRTGGDAARSEAEISRQYGIRNLHQHVLDQIRIKVDGLRGEARIRLHPPELGEIKIHLVMEDSRLTVRMEVAEQLVRHLLERDLNALKSVLAEAGIDVDGFDIQYREKRSHRDGTAAPQADSPLPDPESREEEDDQDPADPTGPIRLSVKSGVVDYLVY